MSHQSTEIHERRKDKTDSRRDVWPSATAARSACQKDAGKKNLKSILCRELKDALVQPGVTNDLPAHTGIQNGFKHVLLEASNDGITLQHVQDRGMTLQNVRSN